jgi:hypothetical protein
VTSRPTAHAIGRGLVGGDVHLGSPIAAAPRPSVLPNERSQRPRAPLILGGQFGVCRFRRAGGATRALLIVLLVIGHCTLAVRALQDDSGTVARLWIIGRQSGQSAESQPVEYPMLTLEVLRLERAISADRSAMLRAVVVTNLAVDLALALILLAAWGYGAAVVYLIGVLLLGRLVFDKTDLLPTLFATLAAMWAIRGRARASGAAVALGAAAKLWPLALSILLLPRGSRRQKRHYALVLIGLGLALVCIWIVDTGWHGPLEVLTFRHAKGWEIESVAGNVQRVFDGALARPEAGAWRLGSATLIQQLALWCAGAAVMGYASWRGRLTQRIAQGWIAIVASVLIFAALLSPQFVLWLLPGAAMAWATRERALALSTLAVALLTRIEFGGVLGVGGFDGLLRGDAPSVVLLSVRNAALIALLVLALVRLGVTDRPQTDPGDDLRQHPEGPTRTRTTRRSRSAHERR